MALHSNSKFLWLVHGLQKGKISENKVSPFIHKAAKLIPENLLKEILMDQCGLKNCDVEVKKKLVGKLRELQIDTQENAIASSKKFKGDFDKTVAMYRGFELTPKENQAIRSFTDVKPILHDKFKVQYSKSDDYDNTSTIIIKKLKEPQGHFVYVAIMKSRAGGDDSVEAPEQNETPPKSVPNDSSLKEEAGEEITLIKSTPIDDAEGSEILTNFLRSIYRTKA